MAVDGETPKGWLVVKVLEVAGHNKEDEVVWDPSFDRGFVRVELRGGSRIIKKNTPVRQHVDHVIEWDEQLPLEVLEGASELRILLCKEVLTASGAVKNSVVAACGIYVRDLLDAVPVDKYFELYTTAGEEGGFVRIDVNYLLSEQKPSAKPALENGATAGREESKGKKQQKKKGPPLPLLVVAAGLALAASQLLLRRH